TVANLTVGWENELVSLRLAGNYKSSYLEEISSLDEPERDRYVDDAFYLDFSAKYYVTDQLQVNFDALNLTDEVFYAYLG
ncbi:MAG TPA: TonB-dependent receptor, partial [Alcanivorax sp.]|nr:TonB-dependent receptor [Alcanivorax sp.]